MHWFEGSITAAITAAKQKRVLFVVYVRGEDDVSKQMDTTWADEGVSQICTESGMIVIRFNSDSDECKQFSQYYPVICVPCVSFISGETGIPLEGAAGYVNASDFKQKIQAVLQMASTQSTSSPVAGTSGQSPAASSTSSKRPSSTPSQPMDTVAATDTQKKELSKLEKAAKLRQKMEEIHQQKEKQKADEAKMKEIERRKVGQAVQQSSQERAEKEARRLAGEIRKEKEEDRLAKERIREQIARDRAEKQSKYDVEKKERLKTKEAASEAAKIAASEAPKRKINMSKGKGQRREGLEPVTVGKYKVWNCLKCDNEYHQPGSLYRHMRIEHGPKLFGFCRQCSFKTNRRDNLRRHYRMEHPLQIDELESIRFESIEARNERVQSEKSETAPATSKRRASRKKKVRKDTTVASSVPLPTHPSEDVSGISNTAITSVEGHLQDAQESEHNLLSVPIKVEPDKQSLDSQPMSELSLAAFGSQNDENSSDLYERIAGGSTDMHQCPKCTKQYTQYTSLCRHIKLDHGRRTFSWCRRCSFYSNRRDNLRRHYKKMHLRYFSDFKKITPETKKQKKRREQQEEQGSNQIDVQAREELMQEMMGRNEYVGAVNESTFSDDESQIYHSDWDLFDDNDLGEENNPEMMSDSETPEFDHETSPSDYEPFHQHLGMSDLVGDASASEIPSSSRQSLDVCNSLLPFMTCSSDQDGPFRDLGPDNDISQVQGIGGDAYSFKCPKCKNVYQNRSSLYRHLRSDHGPPFFLWCRHCVFHTKRKYNLKRHYCHLHQQFVGEVDIIEFETREEVEHRTGQELVLRNRAKLSKKSPWTIKKKYRNMKALPQGSDTLRFTEEDKEIRDTSINASCLARPNIGSSFVSDAIAYPQSIRKTSASSATIPTEGNFPLQRGQLVNAPPMSNKSLQPAMYGGSGMSNTNSVLNYPQSTSTPRMVHGQAPNFVASNSMNFPPRSSAYIPSSKQSPVVFKRPYVPPANKHVPNPAQSNTSHHLVQEPSSVTAVRGRGQEPSSLTAVHGRGQEPSSVTAVCGRGQEPGCLTAVRGRGQEPSSLTAVPAQESSLETSSQGLVKTPSSITAACSLVQEPSSMTALHGSSQEQSSVTSTCENPNTSVPLTKLERVLRGKVTEVVEESHTVTYSGGEKVKEETIKRTYKVMFDAEFGDGKVKPF
ncbi:uncharacterized protein LOC117288205 isoform X1 [Asterias rubens]|uniref:uncharacterized protein LOC117288205 isoform X1 n=1 Tax=Asterias rubens TaxID=7604 RepID=UPI001455539C|nr:uncharacterized protein LOC117288205 isoform X1 [Asterias rubens]